MPEATTIKYTLQEMTALMVKDQGIKKGHWMLQVTYNWAVSNVLSTGDGPNGPSTLSILTGVGIQEAAEPSPLSVDAAEVWAEKPAKRGRRKPAPAKASAKAGA